MRSSRTIRNWIPLSLALATTWGAGCSSGTTSGSGDAGTDQSNSPIPGDGSTPGQDSGTNPGNDSGSGRDSGTNPGSDAGADSGVGYTVGGQVSGYAGTGLTLSNGGVDVVVPQGASNYSFANKLVPGTTYTVLVKTQPSNPTQTCSVSNSSGTVFNANVTNASVSCTTNTYQVCATVSGLSGALGDAGLGEAGTGLLSLQNGADQVSVGQNGQVCFPTKVASGGAFDVTVGNPTNPHHTCTVQGGTGTIVAGDVSTVAVNCSVNTYTIGGAISGLGGTAELTLQDGNGNPLQTASLNSSNGTYAFATPVPSGQGYTVVVSTQPSSPSQICTLVNASGQVANANVTNVDVSCVNNTFSVGGTLKIPTGVVKLQNNGGDEITVGPGVVNFTFPTVINNGAGYAVTVADKPGNASCTLTNDSGTLAGSNVTNVLVDCSQTDTFNFTGGAQTFTVPEGVTSVFIQAWGAQGASGSGNGAGSGGLGGYAEGNLTVTAAEVLNLMVGGQGAGASGGFNGGGNGVASGGGSGGGGGASDVRQGGTDVGNRVLVAGGGGGGGRQGCHESTGPSGTGGNGGAGGGGDGAKGSNVQNSGGEAGGGFGGFGAGTGGSAGVGCGGFLGTAGTANASAVGGTGGTGQSCCCFGGSTLPHGGGGGGGHNGGGGGGGGSAGTAGCSGNSKGSGGGGGGGTSYIGGVSNGAGNNGIWLGNGMIGIVYKLP